MTTRPPCPPCPPSPFCPPILSRRADSVCAVAPRGRGVSTTDGRCRRGPRPAGRRGSALILALVTVIMLLMLGAAYLQIARVDRRTAEAVDSRSNVSDASILRYIGTILEGDIPQDPDGSGLNGNEFYDIAYSKPTPANVQNGSTLGGPNDAPRTVPDRFAPTTVPGPVPNLANNDQPAREPRSATAVYDRAAGPPTAGSIPTAGNLFATGGQDDDPWLASIEPNLVIGSPSYQYWPHITDLSGVFLDLSDISPLHDTTLNPRDAAGRPLPAQYLSTANGTVGSPVTTMPGKASGVAYTVPAASMADVAAAGDLGLFADATGDGIADSRWTWAPLPSNGGQVFIMAVRIIDNSALIDLNAWAFNRSTGGNPDQPRWLWPGELDLHDPLEDVKTTAGTGSVTALDVATTGIGTPLGHNMNDQGFTQRLGIWLDATRQDFDDWETIGTELEQSGVITATDTFTPPTNNFSFFNPRIDEIELRWRSGLNRASDNVNPDPTTPMEALDTALFRASTIPPAETAYPDSGFVTIPNFFYNFVSPTNRTAEPRKQLTVISGSANHGQIDLNRSTAIELSEAIQDGFNFGANPTTPNLYDDGGWTTEKRFADQVAVLLTDFRDTDANGGVPAVKLDFQDGVFGMEYLPFISEVYVQARYAKAGPAVTSPGVNDQVTWDYVPQAYGAAIELVNPWPFTIRMPDVEVFVDDGTATTPLSWGTLAAGFPGKTTIDPYEVLILVKNDGEASAPADANRYLTGADPIATAEGTIGIITPTAAWPVDLGAAGGSAAGSHDRSGAAGGVPKIWCRRHHQQPGQRIYRRHRRCRHRFGGGVFPIQRPRHGQRHRRHHGAGR